VRAISALHLVLLLTAVASAQTAGDDPAKIRTIDVIRQGDGVRIEVTLTTPVNPNVIVATSPDRLVLDLPGTVSSAKQRQIAVHKSGVKRLRVGLHSTDPPDTRVVLDLTSAHGYALTTKANTIVLTVSPVNIATQSAQKNDGAVPPASDPLVKRLWPWQRKQGGSSAVRESAVAAHEGSATAAAAGTHRSPKVPRTVFQVKYVAEGAAYLNGGRSSGLAKGMKLVVRDEGPSSAPDVGPTVADLQVISVAEMSAVTNIHVTKREVKPGDWAYLSAEDSKRLSEERVLNSLGTSPPAESFKPVNQNSAAQTRAQVLSLQDNRLRARVGLDYSGIHSSGSTAGSSREIGMSFQADMTRIAGTYWNLQGYWRGRLTTNSQPDEDTIQDYLDRTYIMQLYYDNPNSKWVAGFGRLYLPWAVSLDTIDGGYVGRRLGHGLTAGVFGGSTPDPTSWHYRPDQQVAGSFLNLEGGNYDSLHYTSTAGVAFNMLKWQLDRPYLFLENGIFYGKYFSVYHSLIVDSPQGVTTGGIKPGAGIGRSYLTFHVQPAQWIGFDVYHNYFRDVPTAATALIGTGLLDKVLYQGVNVGVRIEPVRHFAVYSSVGHSDTTGDTHRSLNQLYGITWTDIRNTGIRADFHYSKFDSPFARGDYRVLTLSRHLGDRMLWNTQFGSQTLLSTFTANNKSLFMDTSFDTNFGRHTFLQTGVTFERGARLNYEQWYMSLGYRFDMKGPGK
jgi:AMIN domain